MLRAHLSLRLFDVPFLSLVHAHVYPDHREYAPGKEPTAVFGRRKVECTPGRHFSSKRSGAEKNLTVVYIPVYSSSRKNGRVTSLSVECAPACFFLKKMDKLQQTMSSNVLVSEVTMSLVVTEILGGVFVDLTHG